jgi:hypothetical protein
MVECESRRRVEKLGIRCCDYWGVALVPRRETHVGMDRMRILLCESSCTPFLTGSVESFIIIYPGRLACPSRARRKGISPKPQRPTNADNCTAAVKTC